MAQIITENEFTEKVLKAEGPVLVDFFATWCGPCKMLAPVIDQVAEEVKGKGLVYKVDVDQSAQAAAQYGIMSIPTLVLFENGEIVQRLTGVQPKSVLVDMFN